MTGAFTRDPRRFTWGASILTAAILVPVTLCLYWLVLDRAPPITVHYGEITGYERRQNGDYVIFVRWHGQRHRACHGVSRRWLVDGARVPLADIPYPPEDPRPVDTPVSWEVTVDVPGYFLTTGHVKLAYRIRIDYACNPIQELAFPIQVAPPPVPFELMPDGRILSQGGAGG